MQIKKQKRPNIRRIKVAMLKPPHEHISRSSEEDITYCLPWVSHEDMKIHETDCIPELFILLSSVDHQNLFIRGRHWIFLIQDMDPKSDTYKQIVNIDVTPDGDHMLEYGEFTAETSPYSQTECVLTVSSRGGIVIKRMPQQWTVPQVEELLAAIDEMSEISDAPGKNTLGSFSVHRVDNARREVYIQLESATSQRNVTETPATVL